jgi:small subunit ribosomal protein S20
LANIASAIKRVRSSERKRVRNQAIRSSTRTHVRKARTSIRGGNPDEVVIKQALTALDRAAAKGIIHKNNAARRKSRLMKQYNQAVANR